MNPRGPLTVRVLVTVKSYPRPSHTHQETVCVAGLTQDRQWIRLYPVKFRQLPPEKQFSKYEWIEVRVSKSKRDYRTETYTPDHDSIKRTGKMGKWTERRSFILPLLDESIEALKKTNRSLGLIRPRTITDFVIERDDSDWTGPQKRALSQATILSRPISRPLEKVPYKFYYCFQCDDKKCTGHKMQFIDWEVYEAYRKWRHGSVSEADVLRKLRDKFFEGFMASRDTYFYVGTPLKLHRYKTFMVIGLFYPPPQAHDQLTFAFYDD